MLQRQENTQQNMVNHEMHPHDIELEQGLLGALLIKNDLVDFLPDNFCAETFYDPLHGRIFNAIVSKINDGRSASPITLQRLFEHDDPISPDMSVGKYIGILAINPIPSNGFAGYAKELIDIHQRRQLIYLAAELREDAFKLELPIADATEYAATTLLDISGMGGKEGREQSILEAADKALQMASDAYQRGGGLAGLSTGLPSLDKALGGLCDTDLIVLAGQPGMGKSSLAMNIAEHVAGTGEHVHVFSLEMGNEQLAARILSGRTTVSVDAMRRGDMTQTQVEGLMRQREYVSRLNMTIDDTGGLKIAQLAARARANKRRNDTRLIVVDYLQLMQGTGAQNRVMEITYITNGLKALAKELNVPIIALSQLSRNVANRENKRPILADLRDSGSIEQDADVVMFTYREEVHLDAAKPSGEGADYSEWADKKGQCKGKAEIIIGKHRHASTGIVELAFDGAQTRFKERVGGCHGE